MVERGSRGSAKRHDLLGGRVEDKSLSSCGGAGYQGHELLGGGVPGKSPGSRGGAG